MLRDRHLPALLVLGSLLALGCGGADEVAEVRLPPVTVEPVRVQTLEDRIEATGELQATDHAQIAAEVTGRITEITVAEGQYVEAGTVVLEIDRERRELELATVRAQLAEARAALVEQKRETGRIRTLHERDVASDSRLDQAQTGLALAQARLDAAQASVGVAKRALDDSSVVAPFAGYIAEEGVGRGEFVNAGQPLFELVSLNPIEVEMHLPEVDSGRVALGQRLAVTVAPYPDQVFRATLTFVSPTIDPRTRTLRVKAQLDNAEGRLRPGLFARADLGVAQREGVVMVREESILQRADGAVLFRLADEGRVERLRIETGVHRDGWVEVVGSLRDGDEIVVRGHADLADGMLVAAQRVDSHTAISAVSEDTGSALP
jgi:membrane fusion protein (multidrug efflux system)